MDEICYKLVRIDPGPVVKLFLLRPDGELMSPMQRVCWRSPLLCAEWFDHSPDVADAPGIHAFRFGYCATPYDNAAAVICRIPPGCRAVISPWAVRAERLIIERIRLPAAAQSNEELSDRVRSIWARHCDLEWTATGSYIADTDHLGFLLQRGSALVEAKAGELDVIRGPRWTRLDVREGLLRLRRWRDRDLLCTRTDRLMRRRAIRIIKWWYDHGDNCVRDLLTPWLRYFDYLR